MMESLAYLHHALAYEDENLETNPLVAADQFPLELPWASSRSRFWRRSQGCFMAVSVVLGLWGMSSTAFAGAMSLLREGDRGSDVQAVQVQLLELGYFRAQPTGYFGPATKEAVMRLQRDHGLKADGVIGPQTQVILDQKAQVATTRLGANSTSPLLRQGDRGSEVRNLQQSLKAAGVYNSAISGYFGTQTAAAVRRFQQQQGLPVDGVVGTRTLTALAAIANRPSTTATPQTSPSTPLVAAGSQGIVVTEIQQRLHSLGYLAQTPTGIYDQATQDAIKNFQRDRNLSVDGQVGSNTLSQLRNAINPEQVRNLQQRLKKGGFYQGSIDGMWGPQTQQALELAQRIYGVTMGDVVQGNY